MSESRLAAPAMVAGESKEAPFASNALRLTSTQWLITAALVVLLYFALPKGWTAVEPFSPGPDYRIPYSLSNDYWLFERYVERMAGSDSIPFLGDSVIWGQYVTADHTLSHFLNKELGQDRFANFGVNGIHPVALGGLVKHYGGQISGRKVVLHFNPLWMSSKRHDLQDDRARRFNHPGLVPQFFPQIPSYDAPFSDRLAAVVDRESSFLSWTGHLRIAYYGNDSIPAWTLSKPYRSPFAPITLALPKDGDTPPSDPIPWETRDLHRQDFAWVEPEESLQWRFFKECWETLKSRDNEVFVVVGPFNEHMLTRKNQEVFSGIRLMVVSWLQENGVAFAAPEVLPSELYADASHPLSAGYARLARQLLDDTRFQKFAAPLKPPTADHGVVQNPGNSP